MKTQDLYILDDTELQEISDLCEDLGFAVQKIIRRRKLIRPPLPIAPAVAGFRGLLEKACTDDEEDVLHRLF